MYYMALCNFAERLWSVPSPAHLLTPAHPPTQHRQPQPRASACKHMYFFIHHNHKTLTHATRARGSSRARNAARKSHAADMVPCPRTRALNVHMLHTRPHAGLARPSRTASALGSVAENSELNQLDSVAGCRPVRQLTPPECYSGPAPPAVLPPLLPLPPKGPALLWPRPSVAAQQIPSGVKEAS